MQSCASGPLLNTRATETSSSTPGSEEPRRCSAQHTSDSTSRKQDILKDTPGLCEENTVPSATGGNLSNLLHPRIRSLLRKRPHLLQHLVSHADVPRVVHARRPQPKNIRAEGRLDFLVATTLNDLERRSHVEFGHSRASLDGVA